MTSLVSPGLSSAATALRLLSGTQVAADTDATSQVGSLAKLALSKANSDPTSVNETRATKITLSLEAAELAFGSDSVLMQTARGRADSVDITYSSIPLDKAAFKAEVLAYQKELNGGNAGFMAAYNAGTVVVQTADEVPELNIQPDVSFTMWKNGSTTGSGGFGLPGFNQALYDERSATLNQSTGAIGSHQFYVFWPKSV